MRDQILDSFFSLVFNPPIDRLASCFRCGRKIDEVDARPILLGLNVQERWLQVEVFILRPQHVRHLHAEVAAVRALGVLPPRL